VATAIHRDSPAEKALAAEVRGYRHGRVPRELRHRQIVAAALELFCERGYEEASMDELARRVGVSKPVVYDAIGSKDQLFHEVMMTEVEELSRRISAAVASEPDHALRLYASALAFFSYVDERRAYWGSLIAADAAPVTREMAAARRHHAEVAARLIAEGAAELGSTLDPRLPDACAHAINGAFESLAAWWQEHPEVAPDTMARLATQLIGPGVLAISSADPFSNSSDRAL
jgi:AcrR family transcriptional regulator